MAKQSAPKKVTPPNRSRADAAVARVRDVASGVAGINAGTIARTVADLRHACDAAGLDYDEVYRSAYGLWMDDVRNGGRATRVEG